MRTLTNSEGKVLTYTNELIETIPTTVGFK